MKKSICSAFFLYLAVLGIPVNTPASDKPLIYAQSGNNSPIDSLLFSSDSRYLASFTFSRAVIWEVASGRSYGEFHMAFPIPVNLAEHFRFKTFQEGYALAQSRQADTDSGRVVYSNDTAMTAEIPNNNAAKIIIRDPKSCKVLQEMGFIRAGIRNMAISEDRTRLYCDSGYSDLMIWDMGGFQKDRKPEAVLLDDNRFILEAGTESIRKLFFTEEKRILTITDTLSGKTVTIDPILLPEDSRVLGMSPEMNALLVGVFGNVRQYRLLDTAGLRELRTFISRDPEFMEWDIGRFAFSSDGSHIALKANETNTETQKNQDSIYVYNILSGEVIRKLSIFPDIVRGFQFTPSGDGMFIAGSDEIQLVKVKTGEVLKTFAVGNEATSMQASLQSNIDVSEDTQWMAMGDYDGVVHLWDVVSGKKIKTFSGKGDGTSFIRITPDKMRMWTSGTDDGTLRLIDISTGREIASLIGFADGQWLAMTPEGYYNAPPGGEQYLNVRVGKAITGIGKFREKFFRPDLVKFALQGGSLESIGKQNSDQ